MRLDEDSSLPTAATESIMLTSKIDAKEPRNVVSVDIPNAFIKTRVEDEKDRVVIRVRGLLIDTLVQIAPVLYGPYITCNTRGNRQLLLECYNALYGTMVASLLYYKKFTNSLTKHGFKANPYDPCMWNKLIKKKQIMICFHVDDCKLLHESSNVLMQTIKWLKDEYESIFEDGSRAMRVHTGCIYEFLGMTLDFSHHLKVKIVMSKYVRDIVKSWDEAGASTDALGFKTILIRAKKGNPAPPLTICSRLTSRRSN